MLRRILMLLLSVAFIGRAQSVGDFLDGSTLQEIRLSMDAADWQKLHDNYTDKKTNYRADFLWRGIEVKSVGIHTRGSGSLNPIKPGLAIEFDKFTAGQRFAGLQSVVLRNFSQDPSTLHETLTMRVFERLGLPFQRTAHVRLFVNNAFAGLYAMTEPIDSRYLVSRFGEDAGYLYEAQGGKDFHFQYVGDAASPYVPTYFDPKTHTADPQGEVIAAWVKAINLATDTDFVASVGRYTDIGAFVAHAAVEVFMGEVDGILSTSGMTNFYLYRRSSDDRFFFLPWDKEMTFVRPTWGIFEDTNENVLLKRALQVPELRKRYLDTLHQAAETIGGPGGWLEQEANREYALIRASVLEDPARVCAVGETFGACPATSFEAGAEYVRSFARERAAFVQAAIEAAGWDQNVRVPDIAASAIGNAASGTTLLAPGAMGFVQVRLSVNGTQRASVWPIPTSLAGVSVEVGGTPAPIIMVSESGVWFQTPVEVPCGSSNLVVRDGVGPSHTTAVEIRPASPGIFAVTHADGSLVNSLNPAAAAELLVIWATGLGRAKSDDASGQQAPLDRLVEMEDSLVVMIAGQPAEVLWAGLAPGYAAMQEIIVRVPAGITAGNGSLRIGMFGEFGADFPMNVL